MFRTVGEGPAVNRTKRSVRTEGSWLQNLLDNLSGKSATSAHARVVSKRRTAWLRVDVPLLLILISLVIFGLIILASASYDYSYWYYDHPGTIFFRQLLWLALGVVAMIVMFFIDYHHFQKVALPALGVTLILLVAVFFVDEIRNGAIRTLFGGSGQPSELAKLVTVVYLSVWLTAKGDQLRSISFGLAPLGVILGLVAGLIAIQPDFSAVVTIFILGVIMFFIAGGNMRHIGVLISFSLFVGYLIVRFTGKGLSRLQDYLAGLESPINATDQVVRSFGAFVEGGWLGVGIGNSQTKLIGLQVPHTDSIFAVVGAETGVVGSFLLVLLFTLLLWRGIRIARNAPDQLGALLAGGMTLWIAIEAFINMAVMVNLLPVAGNALPFVSSGGSNLVTTLAAMGVVMNVARSSIEQKEEKGAFFDAVVSLRRRDGGRRVSSARRTASPRR